MTRTALEAGSVGMEGDSPECTKAPHPESVAWRWRYFGESDRAWTVRKKRPVWSHNQDVELEPLVSGPEASSTIRAQAAELERLRGALDTAREAFFDLIADARKWEEDGDEDGFHYELHFGHHSLLPLMTAFGVECLTFPIVEDEEMFMGRETPAEALYRASNASIEAARALKTEGTSSDE